MSKTKSNKSKDKFRGSVFGLAAGDALGAPVEFQEPGSFEPVSDMRGGAFGGQLKAGDWTDDTSLALCLGYSLVEKKGFDPRDQIQRYVRWREKGYMSSLGHCFDIGNTTSEALTRFVDDKDKSPWAGSPGRYDAGNGSLMRLAPVPLAFRRDLAEAVRLSGDSSLTTHGARAAVDCCRFFGLLLVKALAGESKEALLDPALATDPVFGEEPLHPEVLEVALGSYREKEPPQVRASGFVVRSMEAALWALRDSESFEEGALKAVNLGEDADTVGAIYGQLAGALYGFKGIPGKWRNQLCEFDLLLNLADGLLDLSESSEGPKVEGYPGRPSPSLPEILPREAAPAPSEPSGTSDSGLPPTCWWIEEGKVLGGPFPGDKEGETAAERVGRLLDFGVRSFVDLMEDGETHWRTGELFLPYDPVLRKLSEERNIETDREQFYVEDVRVPESPEHMRSILKRIRKGVDEGRLVYVHCLGGHGRTGTAAGCWLLKRGIAADGEEALEIIRKARLHEERLRDHPSPETGEQQDFVGEWAIWE